MRNTTIDTANTFDTATMQRRYMTRLAVGNVWTYHENEDAARAYLAANYPDAVLEDVCPVNELIANEREYVEEAESAFTQAVGYAALGTFGLIFALCLIP